MESRYKTGEHVFVIENNRSVREAMIVKRQGDFYIIRFCDGDGGIKLRAGRLFASKEEAEDKIPKKKISRLPYDFGM